MTDELEPEPKSWNIWLTLMVISIAFTIAVAVLEYVGVFRDLGGILSAVGLALALGHRNEPWSWFVSISGVSVVI